VTPTAPALAAAAAAVAAAAAAVAKLAAVPTARSPVTAAASPNRRLAVQPVPPRSIARATRSADSAFPVFITAVRSRTPTATTLIHRQT
jgi:hypothetical protein